jgi:predicted ATPase
MKIIIDSLHKFTDIIDIEKIEKFVANERKLMAQELELLKRDTIAKATKDTTDYIKNNIDEKIDKATAPMWNDLSIFAYWFFNTQMNKDGNMESHVRAMFPNSHEQMMAYFDFLEKNGSVSHIKKSTDDQAKKD